MSDDVKRKPISTRMRFEVFKRDNFTCQYCSAKPPKVPLEIDHIIPVSKKGKNTIDNLITACFQCNRGKSNIELSSIPLSLVEKTENIRLAQVQYLAYKKLLKKQEKIIRDEIQEVEDIYSIHFTEYVFAEKFISTVKRFIDHIGLQETKDAMDIACSKIHYDEDKSLKYFCGICWNKIRER